MNCILSGGLSLACLLALTPTAPLTGVQLNPSKDNTLIEPDQLGERSNGVGPQFYAGRIGGFGGGVGLRRGLLAFDVAGSIPAGSTINSVTLTVTCSHVPVLDNGNPRTQNLKRATSNWGEGTSDAGVNVGVGAAPTAGDATWINAFFPGTPWGTAGGDFTGTISSSVAVPSTGTYVFPTSAQFVADVQSMLDSPGGNFGWVMTGDEVNTSVSRAFDSREAPTYPSYNGTAPVLSIDFTGPVAVPALSPLGLGILAVLLVGGCAVLARRTAIS